MTAVALARRDAPHPLRLIALGLATRGAAAADCDAVVSWWSYSAPLW